MAIASINPATGETLKEFTAFTDDEIEHRLLLPMINEAVKVLSEGITDSADTIDLATVFGLGLDRKSVV